ncbi:MAG: hypothetical protein HY059_18475 [Proteobacteria bacterium]|nr:hypothetical protein [Pseudomonadota bacterium]
MRYPWRGPLHGSCAAILLAASLPHAAGAAVEPVQTEQQPAAPEAERHAAARRIAGQCEASPREEYSPQFLDCVSASGSVGVGLEECEATTLCRASPDRGAEWRDMNARYSALQARMRESRAPNADILAMARSMEEHPLYTDLRRREVRNQLAAMAHAVLAPHLNHATARVRAAVLALTGSNSLAAFRTHLLSNRVPGAAVHSIMQEFEGSSIGQALPPGPPRPPGGAQLQTDTDVDPDRSRMVFMYSSGAIHDHFLRELLWARAEHFPTVRLDVIARSPAAAEQLSRRMREEWGFDGERLLRVGVHSCGGRSCPGNNNSWARDGFHLVHGPTGARILLPSAPQGYVSDGGRNLIATFPGLEVQRSRVNWEGGTIITSQGRTFLSEHVLQLNPTLNRRQIEHQFSLETGQPATTIPNLPNLPHIDLYVTPLGGNRVLVGDTRLAWSAIDAAIQAHPESEARIHRIVTGGEARTPERRPSFAAVQRVRNRDLRNAVILDDIAARLTASGFQVDRIPFVSGEIGSQPILTYNNSIQMGRHVFLGRYGIPALDNAAADVYQRHGLAPVQLSALPLAGLGGAIHCVINFLPSARISYRMAEYEFEIRAMAERLRVSAPPPVPVPH